MRETAVLRGRTAVVDVSQWVAHRANWSPEKVAVRFEGREITYASLEDQVGRLAGAFADELGVQGRDRVAYLGHSSPELLTALFACARLGAAIVPMNARLTIPEHQTILLDCQPVLLVAESEFVETAERCAPEGTRVITWEGQAAPGRVAGLTDLIGRANPLPPNPRRGEDTPLYIAYTSGTTGKPKGVVLTHRSLLYNALNGITTYDMTSRDEVLTVMPMFHVGGMNVHTTPAIFAGATVTILRQFEPGAALREIARAKITQFLATPPSSRAMTEHPDWEHTDVGSLRCFTTGATTVPPAVMRPWFQRGVPVMQIYGLTESCPTAIVVPFDEAERKLGAIGKPVAYCEARVADADGHDLPVGESGEILLRGPNLFTEYWQNPAATSEAFVDGWFRTGDVGHVDEEGYFYIDDRVKDVIIVGVSNVYPAELDNILADVPGIAEAAIVGRPDDELGEVPVACVVLREGQRKLPPRNSQFKDNFCTIKRRC